MIKYTFSILGEIGLTVKVDEYFVQHCLWMGAGRCGQSGQRATKIAAGARQSPTGTAPTPPRPTMGSTVSVSQRILPAATPRSVLNQVRSNTMG